VDANISTNLGAGTNEDRILVGRFVDAWLYEGRCGRSRSGRRPRRISVRYNYVAFTFARYPQVFSIVSGTGLVSPTF
jgi:hypothetical protein